MADKRLNPTPKQTAMEIRGFIGKHRELVDSQQFQDSLFFAEAEYIHQLTRLAPSNIIASSSEQAAAACFQRILGAHEFVRTLRNLSESPPAPKPSLPTNLDHTK